jgi:hypothetical protein
MYKLILILLTITQLVLSHQHNSCRDYPRWCSSYNVRVCGWGRDGTAMAYNSLCAACSDYTRGVRWWSMSGCSFTRPAGWGQNNNWSIRGNGNRWDMNGNNNNWGHDNNWSIRGNDNNWTIGGNNNWDNNAGYNDVQRVAPPNEEVISEPLNKNDKGKGPAQQPVTQQQVTQQHATQQDYSGQSWENGQQISPGQPDSNQSWLNA